jgi:hypothetical protein
MSASANTGRSMTWGTAGRFGGSRPFIRSVGVTALAAGTIAAQ